MSTRVYYVSGRRGNSVIRGWRGSVLQRGWYVDNLMSDGWVSTVGPFRTKTAAKAAAA